MNRGLMLREQRGYKMKRSRRYANTASLIQRQSLEALAGTLNLVEQSSAIKVVLVLFAKKGARRGLEGIN